KARQLGSITRACRQDLLAKATCLTKVRRDARRGREVVSRDIIAAVRELVSLLKKNSAELPNHPQSIALNQAEQDLRQYIDYAWMRHRFERIRLYNLLQFSYPGPFEDMQSRSSAGILAPTAIGNIGRTVRSYALTRYNMDLD